MKPTLSLTHFDMDSLFQVMDALMKISLIVCVMVIVATAPTSNATAATMHCEGPMRAGDRRASVICCDGRHTMGDDFAHAESPSFDVVSLLASAPTASESDDWTYESARVPTSDHDAFEHLTNVDGTPMLGDTDINGNSWGIVESHFDDWSSGGMSSSMFD
jgi:hypothetical protein